MGSCAQCIGSHTPWSEEETDYLVKLYNDGMKESEMPEALQEAGFKLRSYSAIRGRMDALIRDGMPSRDALPPRFAWSDEEMEIVRKAVVDGESSGTAHDNILAAGHDRTKAAVAWKAKILKKELGL